MSRLLIAVVLITLPFISSIRADDVKPEVKPQPDYVKLTAEIRGTLHVDKDSTRVSVFLNGSCLLIFQEVLHLDFGKDDELRKEASKLNGQSVVILGTPVGIFGILEPLTKTDFGTKADTPKRFISVKSIKAAK